MDLPYTILSVWRPGKEIIDFFQRLKKRRVSAIPGETYLTFTSSPPASDGYSDNLVLDYRGTKKLPPQFISQSEQLKAVAESESNPIERPTLDRQKRQYQRKSTTSGKRKESIESRVKRAKL